LKFTDNKSPIMKVIASLVINNPNMVIDNKSVSYQSMLVKKDNIIESLIKNYVGHISDPQKFKDSVDLHSKTYCQDQDYCNENLMPQKN